MDDQYKDAIIEAIPAIRNQSKRPGRELIAKHVASKHGLNPSRTTETIEKLLKDAVVYFKVNKHGKESFYVSKLSAECTTQDESAVESDDEFHELFEIPSTPCRGEAHDGPFYDHRDLSDGPCIFGNHTESNLQSHPDPSNGNGGVKFRTQNSRKNEDSVSLANIIGNMAKTISDLNSMLNCERNKAENLLTENFSLKLKNQELQTLVETLLNSQKSHNKLQVDASSKTLEIRSELITEADRHHKGSNSEDDTVIEISNNGQSNENKQKRPSKAKRKSLQRQKQSKQEQQQQQQQSGKQKRSAAGSEQTRSVEQTQKQQQQQNTAPTDQKNNKKKLKVTIVGDSQVKRLDQEKLCNQYRDVEILGQSGMRIKQAAAKTGKTDSDVIIVHAGTNNLSSTSPEQLSTEVLDTLQNIQDNNKQSKVVFSSVFKRTDKGLNLKIIKLHKILNEELTLNGFDIIDNDNIHFSNLAKDGLHLNEGGTRKYASNLSKFMRYC